MGNFPQLENEEARIRALYGLRVLDTKSEERFDRVIRLAAAIFEVPIALLSLIDVNRQWVKSRYGLEVEETPRDQSFCAHAIEHSDIMMIEDATKDSRFSDNPFVTGEPHIRFYAGCPLEAEEGMRVGTLCLIDSKPRTLSNKEKTILKDLGDLLEAELQNTSKLGIDELTGISNRRGFMDIARYALEFASRMKVPVTLIYIDLDNFKEINDTYGHAEGDLALQSTADALIQAFRSMDVLGRVGGDEFCVLCTNLDEKKVSDVLDRMQKIFDVTNQKINKDYVIDYSLGYVTLPPDQIVGIKEILNIADKRMYEQKHKKHNESSR